jgi:hypothetical protein
MGPAAFGALYPADTDGYDALRKEKLTGIVAMDGKAGGMPAGTLQLMKRKGIDD